MKRFSMSQASAMALFALAAAIFSTDLARADLSVTGSEDEITSETAVDTEWSDKDAVVDGDGTYEIQHGRYHPHPRPRPRPRPYPRPAPRPRPYPRPVPRWPVPPYVPPYATPYLYTCYAENARGELFDSRAYNPNVAQDEAIDECYEWGSAECYAIGCN